MIFVDPLPRNTARLIAETEAGIGMARLKHGYFVKALRKKSLNTIFITVPLGLAAWGVILFLPWVAWLEETPDIPALGISAIQKLQNFGSAPFPWVTVGLTVLIVWWCLSGLLQALKSIANPRASTPYRTLAKFGDPDEIIAAFETEAETAIRLKWDKPLLVGTANWLLLQNDMEMLLLPVDKIAWVYDKADASNGLVTLAAKEIGLINSRQAQLSKAYADRTLHVWVENVDDPYELTVSADYSDLFRYLSLSNDRVILGYHSTLKTLWADDRDTFLARAMDFIASHDGSPDPVQEGSVEDVLGAAAGVFNIASNLPDIGKK